MVLREDGSISVDMKDPLAEYKERMLQFKRNGFDMMKARKFILDKADFESRSVLEIGTGKGHTAVGLALRRIKFTTIDLDTVTLKIARKHLSLRRLVRYAVIKKMDAEKLRFKDSSFDYVISVNFIHHAKNPAKCLKEMIRVAKNKLIIADLNKRGERVMEKVHALDGHSHAASKMSLLGVKEYLKKARLVVKVYRDVCQTVIIAKKGVAK
jgi:ubiquinone/menaquinone biosynthesis C-methylase UbiE